MKKSILILKHKSFNFFAILICLISINTLSSCSDNHNFDEKTVKIYKEILVTREMFPDTAIGNPKVKEIFKKFDVSEPEFRHNMEEMAKDKEGFLKLLDSLRSSIIKETDKKAIPNSSK